MYSKATSKRRNRKRNQSIIRNNLVENRLNFPIYIDIESEETN